MHAFCINLDRSPGRLRHMQRQAAACGLDLERIRAIDGDAVPDWLTEQFQGTPLLPGEIGCYASHLVAAKEVVDRSLPFAVVTEDDITFTADIADVVRAAIDAAPAGWDFIHLTEYNLRTLVEVADLEVGHLLVRYSRLPKNTMAYVISNAGARKWLQPRLRACPSDVDVRYAWRFDFKVVGVYPPVAFRGSRFGSDIDATGAARVRTWRRKWAPSLFSRLYGAVWQTRQLGLRRMFEGQVINAVDAVHRRYLGPVLVPSILTKRSRPVSTDPFSPSHPHLSLQPT